MSEGGAAFQSEVQQGRRDIDVPDTSTNRQEELAKQNKEESHNELPTQIEESHTSSILREQQAEDPFRTLRSFHEKQRRERQQNNTHSHFSNFTFYV